MCIEILEHLTDDEIKDMLKKIKFKKIIITVPYVKGSDKTHINVKNMSDWVIFFDDINIHLKIIDRIMWGDNALLSEQSTLFEGEYQ